VAIARMPAVQRPMVIGKIYLQENYILAQSGDSAYLIDICLFLTENLSTAELRSPLVAR
jgi:hypothetical protein